MLGGGCCLATKALSHEASQRSLVDLRVLVLSGELLSKRNVHHDELFV